MTRLIIFRSAESMYICHKRETPAEHTIRFRVKCLFSVSILAGFLLLSGTPAMAQGLSPVVSTPSTLRVAVFDLPVIHSIGKDGKPKGFSIELFEKVAQEAEISYRYLVFPSFAEAVKALVAGEADLMPNIGIIKSRDKELDFSIPVQTFPIRLFIRVGTNDVNSLKDLVGRNVAVVNRNVGVVIAKGEPGLRSMVYDDINLAITSVLTGETDGLIYPEHMFWNRASELGFQDSFKSMEPPLREVKRGIAVRDGNYELLEKLNPVIGKIVRSPEYTRMMQKWYVTPPSYWTGERVGIILGSSILVIVILLGLLHYLNVVRLNRKLETSEARLARALNGTNDGIWEWNIIMGESYFSPRWRELLGYTKEDLAPHVDSFSDLIHPEEKQRVWEAVENHLNNHAVFDEKFRMRTKAGDYLWTRSRGQAQWDAEGQPQSMAGAISDISGEMETQQALMESEASLRRAEKISHIGHYSIDLEGENSVWSDGLKAMWGFAADINPTFEEVIQKIHPEDMETVVEVFRKAAEEKSGLDLIYRMNPNENSELWMQTIAEFGFDGQNGTPRYFGTMVDITTHKKSEDLLKRNNEILEKHVAERTTELAGERNFISAVVDTQEALVVVLDPQGTIVRFNHACSRVSGFTLEEAIGKSIWDIVMPPEEKEEVQGVFSQLTAGQFPNHHENEWVTKNNERRLIAWNNSALLDDSGKVAFVVATGVDITERRQTEHQLEEMREKMAVQDKMATIGQLTATVSHELRNPLGTIRTSVYNLKERLGEKEPPLVRSLERMERNVVRCDNIINDLLNFSRSRPSIPELTIFDPWLEEVLKEQTIPDWLELAFTPGAESLELSIDKERFRRAVINLVENAVQAMELDHEKEPKQSYRLTIHTLQTEETLEVSIADSGKGMSTEVLEKVFEPLYSTKTYGVGLGLPTVKQVMEQEGGGIKIDSEIGKGTTAVLWLSLVDRIRKVS